MQQAQDKQTRQTLARRVAISVIMALVLASLASAQAWVGRGRLSGKISGPDGKPLEGVKITLTKNGVEGEGPEAFFTDKKGRWSYLGLGGGNWTVLLEKEGLNVSEGQVRVSEFGPGQKLQTKMKELQFQESPEQEAINKTREFIDQGNTYLSEGQYAEARAAFEEALPLIDEGTKPALLRGIAQTYYGEEDVDQALAALEKALALVPDDVESLKLAVNLLVASDRQEEAQAYMARLPEGTGADANAVLNMGIQRYNEDDYAGAVEFFDRAAAENPNMVEVFYYRGLAYLGSGNNEKALGDFKKASEIDADYKADEVQPFIEYLASQVGDGESQE